MLIDDLSVAAHEAIEQAAADAAKAASIASLEREASLLQAKAAAMRDAEKQREEALRWQKETSRAKKAGFKNAVITGLVCLLGGLAIGAGGALIAGNR